MNESTAIPDPPFRAWLWRMVGKTAFRCTPYSAFGVRRVLLRWFGATVTPLTKVRGTVDIDRPWNLCVGARTAIGDDVILRARSPITIGDRCTVSQLAMLTTEVRDPNGSGYPPVSAPIVIHDDGWVATDALVLPGVVVGHGTIIGARSLAEGTYSSWQIALGEPARELRARVMRHEEKPWTERRADERHRV